MKGVDKRVSGGETDEDEIEPDRCGDAPAVFEVEFMAFAVECAFEEGPCG